jgi:hypothetical protein
MPGINNNYRGVQYTVYPVPLGPPAGYLTRFIQAFGYSFSEQALVYCISSSVDRQFEIVSNVQKVGYPAHGQAVGYPAKWTGSWDIHPVGHAASYLA